MSHVPEAKLVKVKIGQNKNGRALHIKALTAEVQTFVKDSNGKQSCPLSQNKWL